MKNESHLTKAKELKRLCFLSIRAAVDRLCRVGAWPRPKRARVLQVGRDIYEKEFDNLKELSALIDYLASQDEIKAMYLDKNYERFSRRILRDYWLLFLLNILMDTEGKTVKRSVFTKWFNKFEKELYCETDLWRSIYVIDGMELNGEVFVLDKFTKIMPVSKNTLKSLIPWYSSIPWYDEYFSLSEIFNKGQSLSPSGNAIIVITKRLAKNYRGQPWPAGKDFDSRERAMSALAAIRLTQPGCAYMKFWGEFKVSRFRVLDPIGLDRKPRFDSGYYKHKVNMNRDSFAKTRPTWKELMRSGYAKPPFNRKSTPTRLEIARDRFLKSYDDYWYESLLDLTIALEALFSPDDNRELRHRIAMRCAWLLDTVSKTNLKKDKGNLFKFITRLYDFRSSIVHGGAPEKQKTDIEKMVRKYTGRIKNPSSEWEIREEAVEIARSIVRRSIVACTNLQKSRAGRPSFPFDENFDQLMIASNQQRRWQKAAGVLSGEKQR
jgi:hypothetical protein